MSTERPARFRIVLVSALTPSDGFTQAPPPKAELIAVTPDTFDEVMGRLAPTLTLEFGRGPSSTTLEVPLTRLRAFRPEWLASNVPALKAAQQSAAPAAPKSGSLLDEMLDAHEASTGESPVIGGSTSLLADVVAHPEFRRLEAAWRGAKHLVDAAGAKAEVSVELLPCGREDVQETLSALTPFNAEGDAVALLVVDQTLEATPAEKDLAAGWAEAAERLMAPLVANGHVGWLGYDTLALAGQTNRRVAQVDDPRAVLFRSLGAIDATRWLALAMNGPMARPLHSKESAREGVVVSEREPLFLGASVAVAGRVAAAVAQAGSPFVHTGLPRGKIGDLPVRTLPSGGATCTEALVRNDVAAEAAKAGAAVLANAPNSDFAVLTHVPMVYRGPSTVAGTSRAAELSLADQLFTAAAASAVSTLAEALPSDAPPEALRETAMLSLAAALTVGNARPGFEVSISKGQLHVTLRPDRVPGVGLPSLQLSARLGA